MRMDFCIFIKNNLMSYYKDFLNGIPLRTLSLLDYYDKEKEKIKVHQNNVEQTFEVTLLISLAMPVFVITNEEIRHKEQNLKQMEKLKDELINESPIFNDLGNIKIGKSKKELFSKIEFNEAKNNLISTEKKVLNILTHIRNSLSHGNIKFQKLDGSEDIKAILFGSKNGSSKYTLSENLYSEIKEKSESHNYEFNFDELVIKEKISGWDILLIEISDFKKLLINWCKYLQLYKNPMSIVRQLNKQTTEELRTGTYD